MVALGLWCLNVHFALALGLFAAMTNFIPYIGQLVGGTLPAVMALGQTGSIGDALIVAAMYLAVVGIEGYVVTPLVMGRSLDLNGTTVLIACLFWGYLWGLIGLILAMPITVSMKLVFQTVPELKRWAELMSLDWQSPEPSPPAGDTAHEEALGHRPAAAGIGRTSFHGSTCPSRLTGGLRYDARASEGSPSIGWHANVMLKEPGPMEVVLEYCAL